MTQRKRLKKRTILFLLLLLGALGGLLWDGAPLAGLAVRKAVAAKFATVRQVTPEELLAWTRDPNRPPPLFIDARPADQFAMSHMDGAVEIDPTAPDLAPLGNVPKDTPLVVYDGPGLVGSAMAEALVGAGFSRVSNLEGGLFRWVNEGNPVVDAQGTATRVHPVSWAWGRLLKARHRP